jgi:hypothetical protein
MDYQEKQRLIDLISWGKLPTVQQDIQFVLDIPTSEIKAMSTVIYDQGLDYARMNNLLTEEECLSFGAWSEDDETDLLTLQKDLDTVKRGLLKCALNNMQLIKAKGILKNINKKYYEKSLQKQGLLHSSDKSYATMQQQRYIISQITRLTNGKLFWSTQEAFDSFDNIGLINRLCEFYFLESVVDDDKIRLLARTEPWRSRWIYFKNGGNLFGKDVSRNQERLIFWSHAYDTVFDAYERPAKKVIEDDDLLDSWFMEQSDKVEKNSTKREIDKLTPKKQPKGRQELFIPTDKEGAKEVHGLNTPQAKATIKMRQRVLKDDTEVEDQNFPDSQSEMRQKATQELSKRMHSISNRR